MMQPTEIRHYQVEVRQQNRTLTARLASYGRSYDVGPFTETLRPGVFRKSITQAARTLPLMYEHEYQNVPIGRSVQWQDTDEGLTGQFRLDTRKEAVEAARLVDERLLGGVSVGFVPINDQWDRSGRQPHVDRIEARLLEVSLCALPVYEDAGVLALRSAGHPEITGLDIVATPQLDAARDWLARLRRK